MKVRTRKSAPTPTRRKFDSDWDLALYYYYKILYWFYSRRNRSRAGRFCRSLESVLKRVANKHEAIRGEDCWSLIYEVRGELDKAIFYRRNEIRLIERLQKIEPRLKDYSSADLADRWILLGMLYIESNNITQAIRSVKEAKRICVRKRVKFGSADLLSEYEAELRGAACASGNHLRARHGSNQQHDDVTLRREKAWTGIDETI